MYIFVHESGTCALSDKENAWCTIAAFVLPESKRRALDALFTALRFKHGAGREVKLGAIPEDDFVKFLTDLSKLGAMAFALAVDVSLRRPFCSTRRCTMSNGSRSHWRTFGGASIRNQGHARHLVSVLACSGCTTDHRRKQKRHLSVG